MLQMLEKWFIFIFYFLLFIFFINIAVGCREYSCAILWKLKLEEVKN